ncbi:hypothetical protein KL951_000340 [Ogataea haglerorum]|nr:hypothetical protein KL951_000340 [Ogataea haglerorum]
MLRPGRLQTAPNAHQRLAAQALSQKRDPAAGAVPEARDPALGHAAHSPDQDPDAATARFGDFAGNRPDAAKIGAAWRVAGSGARRKAPDNCQRLWAADRQRLCAPVRHADPGPPDGESAGTDGQGPFRAGKLLAARTAGGAAAARYCPNHISDNGRERQHGGPDDALRDTEVSGVEPGRLQRGLSSQQRKRSAHRRENHLLRGTRRDPVAGTVPVESRVHKLAPGVRRHHLGASHRPLGLLRQGRACTESHGNEPAAGDPAGRHGAHHDAGHCHAAPRHAHNQPDHLQRPN